MVLATRSTACRNNTNAPRKGEPRDLVFGRSRALPGACLSLGPHCPRWSRNVVGHDYFLILLKFALHFVLCWLTGKRRFARCRCPGAWGPTAWTRTSGPHC